METELHIVIENPLPFKRYLIHKLSLNNLQDQEAKLVRLVDVFVCPNLQIDQYYTNLDCETYFSYSIQYNPFLCQFKHKIEQIKASKTRVTKSLSKHKARTSTTTTMEAVKEQKHTIINLMQGRKRSPKRFTDYPEKQRFHFFITNKIDLKESKRATLKGAKTEEKGGEIHILEWDSEIVECPLLL